MRIARRAVALALIELLGTLVGGCSAHHEATGFCAKIQRGNPAFDPTNQTRPARVLGALGAFDRIAASAPATVAPDFKKVSAYLRSYIRNPLLVASDSAAADRYAAAIARVNRYLHDTCGLTIPPVPKLG